AARRGVLARAAPAVRAGVAGAAHGARRRDGDRASRGAAAAGGRGAAMIGLQHFLVVVAILMGVELILNAAALNFVAFAHYVAGAVGGMVFALFIIVLAAAEAAIALAIVLAIFRHFHSIDANDVSTLRD